MPQPLMLKKLKLTWSFWPWRPARPSRSNNKTRRPFNHRRLECKSRKSRDTWRNRQVWSWSTKWSRAKVNKSFVKRTHRSQQTPHPFPATQEMTLHMDITRWSILKSNWLYFLQLKMEKHYTVSKNKIWSWLWLRLIIAKVRLKLKKVGENSRSFRYDLNQIP